MIQSASVTVSGPALSFMLYETCKATTQQYGFLLGEIIHKEVTSITDNEQRQVEISTIIKINSVVPCQLKYYTNKGRVDKDKLRKFLGRNLSKVVAWYKYEPGHVPRLTLKEKAYHKQFRTLFEVPQELFSICFLLMESTENLATYNYKQYFMRYSNGDLYTLNMHIPNLSEPNNTYKTSEPASEVFNKILSSIKMDIDRSKGVVAVTEIENAVQKHINETVEELAAAERTLFDLEEEIRILVLKQPLGIPAEQVASNFENIPPIEQIAEEDYNVSETDSNKQSTIVNMESETDNIEMKKQQIMKETRKKRSRRN